MLSRPTPTESKDITDFRQPDAIELDLPKGDQEAVPEAPGSVDESTREHDQTKIIWVITAVVVAGAAIVQIFFVPTLRPMAAPFELPWWVFVLALAAAEVFIVHLPVRRDTHTISLSELATVLGFAFVSPHMLILARLGGSALALGVYRRQRLVKMAFNMALFYLDLVVALAVYRAVLGDASPNSPTGWLAALIAASAAVIVSAALVTTVVWLHDRDRSQANILRSLAAGSLIPVGTSLVGVLCMIVLWQDPRAALVLVAAAGLFYLFIRTYGRLSKRHDDLRAIYSFTETIHAGLSDDQMQIELLGAAQEHLRASIAELLIEDPSSGAYTFGRLEEEGALKKGSANELRIDRLELFGASTQAPVSFNRHSTEVDEERARDLLAPFGFESGLIAPLYVDGSLVGAVAVGNRLGPIDTFDGSDHALIETMAQHASLTIERLRLTASLQHEVEINQRLLESKDDLLASVSHELRTPLTGILGFAELVRDGGDEMGDTERISMVGAIAAEALDLTNVVEDLLTAARAGAGKLTITSSTVQLRALVERVLESHEPAPPRTLQIRGGDASAVADPARVRQVVRNLLTNAERYGGQSILVTIESDAGGSRIAIADNGEGIPTDGDVGSIFEPYQSAHDPDQKVASVGIGLTISRALARLMNGDLTYRRESGWTIFELSLPGGDAFVSLAPPAAPSAVVPDAALRRRRPVETTIRFSELGDSRD